MLPQTLEARIDAFTDRCVAAGLAATHQRRVIFRVLAESEDHPSPETVYERVRQEIPSISQATVYKNIRLLVEIGLLHEVSQLHQTSRLDANLDRHHHLVCTECKRVVDYYDPALDGVAAGQSQPHGFQIERYQVEMHGLCPDCQAEKAH